MNRTGAIVFLSVFAAGLAVLFALKGAKNPQTASNDTQRAAQKSPAAGGVQSGKAALSEYPLKLPMSARNVVYSADGWECSGEFDANFVSAFGQLSSGFQNLGWKPAKRISIDRAFRRGKFSHSKKPTASSC